MRHVLISNPSSLYLTFLPYIHSLLKSHAMTDPRLVEAYDWMLPIYHHGAPDDLLKGYDLEKIDVLGLSCYVWNFAIQVEIARKVKAANPHCLVVAGGPEPDWKDEGFFEKFPMIDIVVRQDGEIPFQKILLERLNLDQANYAAIPGVIARIDGRRVYNAELEKPNGWSSTSPYCDDPQMAEVIRRHPKDKELAVIWETNRGCPYSCRFCDWGSNVSTRIRAFPMEKLQREIDWFSQNRVQRIYITDANFGILPRDEQIIDEIVAHSQRFSFPQIVDWCAAKNNIERVTRICIKLNDAGLNRGVLVGYQSTDAEVLKAMSRLNMAEEQHRNMVTELNKANVHVFAAIILGCPGDTQETFRKTIHDLLEMGFHDSIRCYLYAVLPNAPAADDEYLRRYAIKTKRAKVVGPVTRLSDLDQSYFPRMNYIVGHKEMSELDWICNCQYYACISGLHNLGLTRYIALLAHKMFHVSFADFYSKIFDSFVTASETVLGGSLEYIGDHLRSFLSNPEGDFFIRSDKDQLLYEHEKWLFLELLAKRDVFYEELGRVLKTWLGASAVVDEVVRFQKFALVPIDDSYSMSEFFEFDFFEVLEAEGDAVSCQPSEGVVLSRKQELSRSFPWLSSADSRLRRRYYVSEVLGSMIYKQSRALGEADDFIIS